MKRSTLLSFLLGTVLAPHGLAQEAPQAVPEPAPVEERKEEAPLPGHPAELEVKITPSRKVSVPKNGMNRRLNSVVARDTRGVASEVRTFAFSNDAFGVSPGQRPLMIRSSRADAKMMDQLSDDLMVMTRILDKTVAEKAVGFQPAKAAGIDILTLGAALPSSGRAIYVDDYGVIFTLSVNMPLKAEPKVEEVVQKEPVRRGPWEETRHELFGSGPRRTIKRWQPSAWRQFDQDEVDAFKATLLETLRNATNIRHLKPTDMIAVVVRGTPQAEERDVRLQLETKGDDEQMTVQETANPESTLVLRVQKMDLDRAVSGRDSGELKKSVRISIY
jgi:hypothetical protein